MSLLSPHRSDLSDALRVEFHANAFGAKYFRKPAVFFVLRPISTNLLSAFEEGIRHWTSFGSGHSKFRAPLIIFRSLDFESTSTSNSTRRYFAKSHRLIAFLLSWLTKNSLKNGIIRIHCKRND